MGRIVIGQGDVLAGLWNGASRFHMYLSTFVPSCVSSPLPRPPTSLRGLGALGELQYVFSASGIIVNKGKYEARAPDINRFRSERATWRRQKGENRARKRRARESEREREREREELSDG
jgi:hypothetical protein